MTQIRNYIPANRRQGELGVHSLDHFSLNVPDLAEARSTSTGVSESMWKRNPLDWFFAPLGRTIRWAVIAEGSRKSLGYLSFGAFDEDFAPFREKLERLGIQRLDPPPGFETNGLWFRDHDGNLIEIQVCEKTSPDEKSVFSNTSAPPGQRGAPIRANAEEVRPRRLSHVLLFTTDVDRAIRFYQQVLGLRLSDRGGDAIAFMHGIHGSDHHILALAQSSAPGFHHASWGVDSINEVGLGAIQMADRGYSAVAGDFSGTCWGRTTASYVRDPWGSYFEIQLRHRLYSRKRGLGSGQP